MEEKDRSQEELIRMTLEKLKQQNANIQKMEAKVRELTEQNVRYREVIKNELSEVNKVNFDISPEQISKSKELLLKIDFGVKEKIHNQFTRIYETLKSFDMLVQGHEKSFNQILDEVDLPTAITMLITNIKRQNVQVFNFEQTVCAY